MVTIKDEIEDFKTQCKRYIYCKKKKIECEYKLEEIGVQILGVKSPTLDGVYVVHDLHKDRRNELFHIESQIIEEKEDCIRNNKKVDSILGMLNKRDEKLIKDLYVYKKNHEMIAEKYHFGTRKSMYYHVDRVLERILTQCEQKKVI